MKVRGWRLCGLSRVVRPPGEGLTLRRTGHVAVCCICDGCGHHKWVRIRTDRRSERTVRSPHCLCRSYLDFSNVGFSDISYVARRRPGAVHGSGIKDANASGHCSGADELQPP